MAHAAKVDRNPAAGFARRRSPFANQRRWSEVRARRFSCAATCSEVSRPMAAQRLDDWTDQMSMLAHP